MNNIILILGNARDYHAMDWYRTVKLMASSRKVIFLTDLVESEGHKKIIDKNDNIQHMVNVDKFLLKSQSVFGNTWRNIVKLVAVPFQVFAIRRFLKRNNVCVVHAHTMYYMFLCYLAKVPFIGTPQGCEVLNRPDNSKLYKFFAKRALKSARAVTVDSVKMCDKSQQLCGVKPVCIQNGIDIARIQSSIKPNIEREYITSVRGMSRLYRINEILKARDHILSRPAIQFIYPLWEDDYRQDIMAMSLPNDQFIGRLERDEMYKLLNRSKLVLSIPISDSSPRSVYEAIFCGCCVAVTYNKWVEALPDCMRNRLYIVDLDDQLWLAKAIQFADEMMSMPYIPSNEAIERFDQSINVNKLITELYDLQ